MRISEAMRRGCGMKPRQVFGAMFDGDDGACALGAVLTGGREHGGYSAKVLKMKQTIAIPPCQCVDFDAYPVGPRQAHLEDLIIHLNDIDHWKREAIADWIEKDVEGMIPPEE